MLTLLAYREKLLALSAPSTTSHSQIRTAAAACVLSTGLQLAPAQSIDPALQGGPLQQEEKKEWEKERGMEGEGGLRSQQEGSRTGEKRREEFARGSLCALHTLQNSQCIR